MFHPAWQQKAQSLDSLIWMSVRLADYYEKNAEPQKARKQLQQAKDAILLFKNDEIPAFWTENYYLSDGIRWLEQIDRRIENLQSHPDQRSWSEGYIFTRFS